MTGCFHIHRLEQAQNLGGVYIVVDAVPVGSRNDRGQTYPGFRFDIEIAPVCPLVAGTYWVGIQDTTITTCLNVWFSSPIGDGTSLRHDADADKGQELVSQPFDLSLCID